MPEHPASASEQAAIQVARSARGRILAYLAYLAYRFRDIAAAEDALAEAFASALNAWPHSGVPDSRDGAAA